MTSDSARLDQELHRLRANGLVMPSHPARAMQSYGSMVQNHSDLRTAASNDLDRMSFKLGRPITTANYDTPEVQRLMRENQAISQVMGARRGLTGPRTMDMVRTSKSKTQERLYPSMPKTSMLGGGGTGMGGDVFNAIPRFYDPLEYWDLSGLPWNVADEGHRHKLHKWLRLYYATHYLVPILVDIFTRFPLVGMELECKDPALVEIYNDIFLNQLNYEDFLVGLGREYWLVGEVFPLGSFDEDLGIWEHEELINPEDVVIDNFPLLDTQQLKIVPPDYLRRIAQTRSPAREWYMLQEQFGDLIPYLLKGEHIPISPVMIRQVANKLNNWDDHGTPILMRGLRTLLHEEKLLASQDAIAERLYSPFLLAKLGIMDMGDGLPPWLPTQDELQSVRDDIDIAMASDFRVMVHHFGLELSSVFGREQMPRLGDDFDRIERRLMQVFGVNPSLLSAGSNSQPYASSALQAEFMNQILRTFQKMLKDHFKERALIVAQAQGHYAYDRKGQTRVPIYENVVEWDEEGNKIIKREHKLLVPDLEFSTFDLRDEATERQFIMGLREAGLPIPDDKLMIGVSWKHDDYVTAYNRDVQRKTISQQRAKMDTYLALVIQGLPVPMDLKYEVESVLNGGTGPTGMPPGAPPEGGGAPPGGAPPGGGGGAGEGKPGGGGIVMPGAPPGLLGPGPGTAPPGGGAPPMAPQQGGPPGNVPQVSNERRPGLTYNTHTAKKLDNVMKKADGTYGDGWVNHDEHKLILSFGDWEGDLCQPARRAAERAYPDYSIDVDCEVGAPEGDEWEQIYEGGQKLASIWEISAGIAGEARLANDGELARLTEHLPEGWRMRAAEVRDQLEGKTASIEADIVEEDSKETDDPATWVLRSNQVIAEHDGETVIVESNKKRIEPPVEAGRRYSIIDPLSHLETDADSDDESIGRAEG